MAEEQDIQQNDLQRRFLKPLQRNFIQAQALYEYNSGIEASKRLKDEYLRYEAAKDDEGRKAAETAWYAALDKTKEHLNAARSKWEEAGSIELSEEEQAMNDAIARGDVDWKATLNAAPELLAQIGGQAVPLAQGALARIAGGAVAGTAAGPGLGTLIGAGGGALSTFLDSKKQNEMGDLISGLNEAGIDPFNAASVAGYLDSEGGQQLRDKIGRGATTRAAVDAASTLVGGGKIKPGASVLSRVGQAAKDTVLKQMPIAAAGETLGQLAQEGRVYEPGGVLAEAVAELPGGAIESLGAGITKTNERAAASRLMERAKADAEAQAAGRKIVEERAAKLEAESRPTEKQTMLPLSELPAEQVNPLEQASNEARLGTTGAEVVAKDPSYGWWSKFMEKIVDSGQRIKQLLPNAYNEVSVAKSKQAQRSAAVVGGAKEVIQNTFVQAQKAGLNVNDVAAAAHNYAVANQAIDLNKVHGEGASGISTQQALETMRAITSSPVGASAVRVANELVNVRKQELNLAQESGFVSKADADNFRTLYPNSVPFYRESDGNIEIKDQRKIKQFYGQNPIKFFEGSDKAVENVANSVFGAYERMNKLAGQKDVFTSVINSLRENPYLRNFVEVVGDNDSSIDKGASNKHIMALKQFDKTYYLNIKDEKLAEQLNGFNKEASHPIVDVMGKMTSFMGANFTRRVPFFGLVTSLYDIVEGGVNTAKDVGAKRLPAFYKNYAKGVAIAIKEAALGNNPANVSAMRTSVSNEDVAMYRLAVESGALTGSPMQRTPQDRQMAAMVQYAKNRANPIAATALTAFEHIENWNAVSDVATRFAAFKTAIEQGKSVKEAAVLAQNVTVNFNNKGTWGKFIGSLYAFVNAGMQGSRRMFNTMFVGKNGKFDPSGFVYLFTSAVIMQTMLQQYNDAVDKDWEELRENDLKRNIVIALGDGKYLRIPTPWGLRTLNYIAHTTAKAARGKDVALNSSDLASMLSLAVEAYSPFGGGDVVQMITPTIFDPLVDIERNVSYSGSNIEPEYKHGQKGRNIPVKERFYDSLEDAWLGRAAISASSFLNDNNIAEISPARLNYLVNGYLGGAVKFPSQVAGLAENTMSGRGMKSNEVPVMSRFLVEVKDEDRARLLERRDLRGEIGAIKEFAQQNKAKQYYEAKQADAIMKKIEKLDVSGQANALRELNARDTELADAVLDKLKRSEKTANKTTYGLAISNLDRDTRLAYISSKLNELGSAAEREAYVDKLVREGAITVSREKNSAYRLILQALVKMRQNEEETDRSILNSMSK